MRSVPASKLEHGLVDLSSPVPVFVQVEQDIRRQILSGALKSGARLPRETELAKLYGISRMTIRHALEGLAEANLVRREHGVGTIVLPPPLPLGFNLGLMVSFTEQLRKQGYEVKTVPDLQAVIDPPDTIREALRLNEGEKVVAIRRVRIVDNRRLALTTSWLSDRLFPGLSKLELKEGSLWATLAEQYGTGVVRADNTVELIRASDLEAHLLHVEADAPLLCFTGTAFDADDRPLEFTTALWSAQVRFHFGSQRSQDPAEPA